MKEGYVKLWRKSLNSEVFKNSAMWMLWSYILMTASHKKHVKKVGKQEIPLSPGQLVFQASAFCKKTGLTRQVIRSNQQKLKKAKKITIKKTNKFSLITVVKWDTYQENEKKITNKITNKIEKRPKIQPSNDEKLTIKRDYTIYNKNVYNKNNTTRSTENKNGFDPKKLNLPQCLPTDLWNEFVDYRKEIKNPLNEIAAKKAINLLKKIDGDGYDLELVVGYTLMSGKKKYPSFYPQPIHKKSKTSEDVPLADWNT